MILNWQSSTISVLTFARFFAGTEQGVTVVFNLVHGNLYKTAEDLTSSVGVLGRTRGSRPLISKSDAVYGRFPWSSSRASYFFGTEMEFCLVEDKKSQRWELILLRTDSIHDLGVEVAACTPDHSCFLL